MKSAMLTLAVRVDVKISWGTAIKMMLIGRHPAAIIARAIADKIRGS